MIFISLWSYLIYFNQLYLITATDTDDTNYTFNDKIICAFRSRLSDLNLKNPDLNVSSIPDECDIIAYYRFYIDDTYKVSVNYNIITELKQLKNKPIYVSLARKSGYKGWIKLLTKENDYTNDIQSLCDFINTTNVEGFILSPVVPMNSDNITLNVNASRNLPKYLQQLKSSCPVKIGLYIIPFPSYLGNPCANDFSALNSVVDFYALHASGINNCDPTLTNVVDPVKLTPHGYGYRQSLEEISITAKETMMNYDKVVYVVGMFPTPMNTQKDNNFLTYKEVCAGNLTLNNNDWCISTTRDYYEKGVFLKDQKCGILAVWIDQDDISGVCGCGPFIGLQNIVAGYKNSEYTPCAKFDIKCSP